jgi:hypothetical protein
MVAPWQSLADANKIPRGLKIKIYLISGLARHPRLFAQRGALLVDGRLDVLDPKNFMITEKNTGVRKMPNNVTPIIPLKTAVPRACRISGPGSLRSHQGEHTQEGVDAVSGPR